MRQADSSPPFRLPPAGLWVVFSIPILLAARGDLWLDEIWSLDFARSARSVTDLFLGFRHDNNHPLNTLFLYAVREQPSFLVDRLLAVLSGVGSLILASQEARRAWGERAGSWAVILLGTSFPLVLYFSEARGYAPAIFFSLLAYAALVRNINVFAWHRLVLYWVASVLGVLSHSTFVIVFIALAFMHVHVLLQGKDSVRRRLGRFVVHQLPALGFMIAWFAVYVRHMEVGGGPILPAHEVVAEAAAYLLGLPATLPWSFAALGVAVLIIVLGTVRLRQAGSLGWMFFPAVLVLAPALVLIIARPKFLYFRYFILSFPFFYMLLAYLISRARRGPFQWILLLAVLGFMAGHVGRMVPLLEAGRGGYGQAWRRIATETPLRTVLVGSDHDFRNRTVISFYAGRDPMGKLLYYVPRSEWSRRPPEWVLVTEGQLFDGPPPVIPLEDVGTYRYDSRYEAAAVSGWGWFLYRRETPATRSSRREREELQ